MDNLGQLENTNDTQKQTPNNTIALTDTQENTQQYEPVENVTTTSHNKQISDPVVSETVSQCQPESPTANLTTQQQQTDNCNKSETTTNQHSTAVNDDLEQRVRTSESYQQSSDSNQQNYCQELQSFSSGKYFNQSSCDSLEEQSDSASCNEGTISSYQTDTDSGFESSSALTQSVNTTLSFKVTDSRQVQIGSTIDVHGPTIVTENSWQNLPIRPQVASTQVNLHGSEAHIGSRVNYHGPVNMIKTVKLNTIEYEELERLAIEDQQRLTGTNTGAGMTHVGPVKFISRDEWGAKPSLEPLKRLQHPVPYVVLTHTGGEEVTTEDKCKSLMRIIQQRYFDCANWVDVAQNYLIGGDGNVYEGRGWDLKGAFAEEYNPLSIGIGMIGNFSRVLPSNKQLRALVYCIQEGVRLGKISQDYKILTHQQLKGSISPGTSFIRLIKTWPRWSDTPRHEVIVSPRYTQCFSGQQNGQNQELAVTSQTMLQKLTL